jgi:hypothetical protein
MQFAVWVAAVCVHILWMLCARRRRLWVYAVCEETALVGVAGVEAKLQAAKLFQW